MNNIIKHNSLTLSLNNSSVTSRSPYGSFLELIQENIRVLFSLGFSDIIVWLSPFRLLSKKQKNYINFRVLHTKVKLFNSFTCKTLYSLLLKELFTYYTNILSLIKRKPLKILVFNYMRQPKADLMSDSSPSIKEEVFSDSK